MMIEIANKVGVDYKTAQNGNEGVEIVEDFIKNKKRFDIIFMDLIMPCMDGYEATKEIRRLEREYNIEERDKHYICACSAEVNAYVERMVFSSTVGCNDITPKPMSLETLNKMLMKAAAERNE